MTPVDSMASWVFVARHLGRPVKRWAGWQSSRPQSHSPEWAREHVAATGGAVGLVTRVRWTEIISSHSARCVSSGVHRRCVGHQSAGSVLRRCVCHCRPNGRPINRHICRLSLRIRTREKIRRTWVWILRIAWLWDNRSRWRICRRRGAGPSARAHSQQQGSC